MTLASGWYRTVERSEANGRWHWWTGRQFQCGVVLAPDAAECLDAPPVRVTSQYCVTCFRTWQRKRAVEAWRAAHGE